MQDLNDMVYFAEVVQRGGFAAAGRALGLPKSRLSRRVAELEARLGVRLLQRTTRSLSLTSVGEAYLRHCLAMQAEALAADEAVQQVRAEPRGTVRVTCPVTMAQGALGTLLPQFMAANPLVRVEMEVTNRVVDLVEEGVDVALRVRPSLSDSGSLVVKRLSVSTGLLVASPVLLQRQGMPQTPEDLLRLDTVAMSASEGRASTRLFNEEGTEWVWQHQPRYIANDLMTLKLAVLGGVGAALLPRSMCAKEVEQGQLIHIVPGWGPPKSYVHAVFASRRGLVPAVRRFLDFLETAGPMD